MSLLAAREPPPCLLISNRYTKNVTPGLSGGCAADATAAFRSQREIPIGTRCHGFHPAHPSGLPDSRNPRRSKACLPVFRTPAIDGRTAGYRIDSFPSLAAIGAQGIRPCVRAEMLSRKVCAHSQFWGWRKFFRKISKRRSAHPFTLPDRRRAKRKRRGVRTPAFSDSLSIVPTDVVTSCLPPERPRPSRSPSWTRSRLPAPPGFAPDRCASAGP